MLKYGMKYSTIRYWQNQARMLYRTNGIYAGRQFLEAMYGPGKLQAICTGKQIGEAAIQFAAVASPEHLKAVLTGTRGRRWSI